MAHCLVVIIIKVSKGIRATVEGFRLDQTAKTQVLLDDDICTRISIVESVMRKEKEKH